MPIQYSGSYAVPRADLGAAFEEFSIAGVNYIAGDVLPVVPVARKAGTFSKITRESLLREPTLRRAAGSDYNTDTYQAEDQAYACEEYGLVIPLDDGDRQNYRFDFDAEAQAVQKALQGLRIGWERRVAALVFNTSTWTGATLYTDRSATPWATSTVDVVGHVMAAKEKVRALTGMTPNTLLINQANLNNLVNNDDLVGRVGFVQVATEANVLANLAAIFGLQRVLVGNAVYNSADEGLAYSGADIWSSTYAMVCVTAPSASLAAPCIGRSLLWTDDSPSELVIEQYRNEDRRSDMFRVRHYMDELVIDASFGHLLKVA